MGVSYLPVSIVSSDETFFGSHVWSVMRQHGHCLPFPVDVVNSDRQSCCKAGTVGMTENAVLEVGPHQVGTKIIDHLPGSRQW